MKLTLYLLLILFNTSYMVLVNAQPLVLYPFDSAAEQALFKTVTMQSRCLVCQNESLWDSNAGLAQDLRTEIYQKIKQGANEAEIKAYLTNRYGQFILFKPQFNTTTYILWVTPFILLIIAIAIVIAVSHSRLRPRLNESNQ